jgi:nucleoid DNA-binding protein
MALPFLIDRRTAIAVQPVHPAIRDQQAPEKRLRFHGAAPQNISHLARSETMPTATASSYLTKSEVFKSLSESTGLTKQQITAVFENLNQLIESNIGRKGTGIFVLPGIAKIKVIRKPATKERSGINPFTGEETTFKAKPARNVVKIQPLKALKDMV